MSDDEAFVGSCICVVIGACIILYILSVFFEAATKFLQSLGLFFEQSWLYIVIFILICAVCMGIIIMIIYCCNAWKYHGYPVPNLPQLPPITLFNQRPRAIIAHNRNNICIINNGEANNLIRRLPIEAAPNPPLITTEINEEVPELVELNEIPNNIDESNQFQCVTCFEIYSLQEGFISCKSFESFEILVGETQHQICIYCIRRYSHAAIVDMKLAPGGIGLRCPDPNCTKVLHFAEFIIYLCPEDHLQLEKRMQHESITSANLSDLVTCSLCSLQFCVEEKYTFFNCECGRIQCRKCPRVYDKNHQGKTCEEVNENEKNGKKIESKLSEIVVRVCHRCNIQYVKQDGCNKMSCQCGATQCYICRENDINYDHFCHCGIHQNHGKCTKCKKTCRLFENAEELDEYEIKKISSKNNKKF